MSISKEEARIILGMAKNISDDAVVAHIKAAHAGDADHSMAQYQNAKNSLDFSMRRLEAYLKIITIPETDEKSKG